MYFTKNIDCKNIKQTTDLNLNVEFKTSKIQPFKISEILEAIKNILNNPNYPDIINFQKEYGLNPNNQSFIENELNILKELITPYIDNPLIISKILFDIKNTFLLIPNPKLLSIINSICEISPTNFLAQTNILISIYQSVFTENYSKNFSEISEYFGDLIKILLYKIDTYSKFNYIKFKRFCLNNMLSKNKNYQICGTLCLTSFIENCEYNYTEKENLNNIFETLIKLLNNPDFNGKIELLNCFTSLIYCSEKQYKPYFKTTLNNVINYCSSNESLLRKFSLNIIYALVYYFQNEIKPMKDIIINELYFLKNDQNKEIKELYSQIINMINKNNIIQDTKKIKEEENENYQDVVKDHIRKKTEFFNKEKLIKKIKNKEKPELKNIRLKNFNTNNQLKSSNSERKMILKKNRRITSLQNINPFNISLKKSNSRYYNNNNSDNSLSKKKKSSISPTTNKMCNFKSSFQHEANNSVIPDITNILNKNKKLYITIENNTSRKYQKRLMKLTKIKNIPNNRYKKTIPTTGYNNHLRILNKLKLIKNNNSSSKNNINKNTIPSSTDNNIKNSEICSFSHTRFLSCFNNISTIPSYKINKNSPKFKKNISLKKVNTLIQNTSTKMNSIDERNANISLQEKINFRSINQIIKRNRKIKLPTNKNRQLSSIFNINQNNFLNINKSLSNVYNPVYLKVNSKNKKNNNFSENDQSNLKETISERTQLLSSRLPSSKIKKKIKYNLIKNLNNSPINNINSENNFDVYKAKTSKIINDLKTQVSNLQSKLNIYETSAKKKENLNSLMEVNNFNDAFKFAIELNDTNRVYYVIKKFQFINDKNNANKEVIKPEIFAGIINVLCGDILSCDNLSLVLLFIKKIINTKINLYADTKIILKRVLNQIYEKHKELCLSFVDVENIVAIINVLNKK